MIVCAHGDVADFCSERDMSICEIWTGDLRDYRGRCCVLVTDQDMSKNEYYFLKSELLSRGVELVSTRYKDDKLLSEYLVYANSRCKARTGRGRPAFGDTAVIQRILELRAVGMTIRAIREDEGVRHSDGRKLSTSTILNIIRSNTKDG